MNLYHRQSVSCDTVKGKSQPVSPSIFPAFTKVVNDISQYPYFVLRLVVLLTTMAAMNVMPPGLVNLSQNCYLNCVIQMLKSMKCFNTYLRRHVTDCEVCTIQPDGVTFDYQGRKFNFCIFSKFNESNCTLKWLLSDHIFHVLHIFCSLSRMPPCLHFQSHE